MKRFIVNSVLASLVAVLGMGLIAINAHAEEGDNQVENTENVEAPKTSMTLTPVSRTLEIASNSVYDGNFSVTNNGAEEMKIEVYAAPYSYV